MESCLVSIIVPAYNVEKYIKECVISILHQTHTKIELILVDDGSKDSTPAIIDKLACIDNRIRVIHKQNGGVSAARNIGIEVSKGQYITFVDGDDYLTSDYVEYMLSLIEQENADFGLSTDCFVLDTESQTSVETKQIMTPVEATALLIGPRVIVGCWNKIFKRQFILNNNLKFSTSLFYGEGLTFITDAAQRANKIIVGNRKVYYYRRNNNESATTKFNLQNFYNGEKALQAIKERLIIEDKAIDDMWLWHMCMFYLGAIVKVKANKLEKEYNADYTKWKSFIRKNFLKLAFIKNLSMYRKLMLLGGCINSWLMMKLDQCRRNYIYNHSVKSI